ncbi:hypothetical protein TNCV_2391411 [Trichonephila clavipes]|nr:hypothetical protein TNCV_2391411 [Trichonephila clavipes]
MTRVRGVRAMHFIPSHKMLDPYDDIFCKQATCVLLGVSRYRYVHNDAHMNGIRLKRRYSAKPVLPLGAPLSLHVSMLQCQGKSQ